MTYDEAFTKVINNEMEVTCDEIYPAFVTNAKKQYLTFKNRLIDCFTSREIIKYNPVSNDFEWYGCPPDEVTQPTVVWREYTE
jgi:hypothetical protein